MKTNQYQKGFSVVEAVIIILVVAVLGLGGWYVWSRSKNDSAKNKDTSTSSQASQSQAYLDIKEWKIRLPLSSTTADAYYVVNTSSQDDDVQPNTVWLGVKSLDAVCPAANANTGGKPLAGLSRTLPSDTDPVSGDTYQKKYPDGTTLDGYYYGYADWVTKSPCTTDSSYQAKLQELNTAFAAAAKSIIAE